MPANAAGLQIDVGLTSGGPAHFYVQKDAPPWFNNALFQIQNNDITHTLSIDATSNPPLTAGRWYVGIQAPGPQDVDFNLTATLSPQLTLPMNATRMEYTLVGNGPGDGDHLYRWGSATYLAEFHQ